MSYFRRSNQPKELVIPSSFDVTTAFRFASTGSRRTANQFNLSSQVKLRRQLSAIFDPDDGPPPVGHSARQVAKIAIAVGLLSQTMVDLAEVAVEKGHPRAKWSGTAEAAFEALKNNTLWPVKAFWPRLGLAQEESLPSTSSAAPTADAGTFRSQGFGKPFPEFILTRMMDFCDEKSFLALVKTCKAHSGFADTHGKEIMLSSRLVSIFMRERNWIGVQLPPPGFTPRGFLEMLASGACAECGKNGFDTACDAGVQMPLCFQCRKMGSRHLVDCKSEIRSICMLTVGLMAPSFKTCPGLSGYTWGTLRTARWRRDLLWLARDNAKAKTHKENESRRESARAKKRARAVKRFAKVLEAEPDWLKEHHVFDRIAAGELGVVKDHDEILSELQNTMARDKALHDPKDQLHPLTKRAIDRKRLLLSKADVAPNLIREALERFSEALYKSKASDEAVVERLRRFDFLRAARLAVDDWIVLLLPTRDERLAWMKADCNSIDFDKIVTYCSYTTSVNQIADPCKDYIIFRDRIGFSMNRPMLWTETKKKIMDAVERLNLVHEYLEETHSGSKKLSFDEVTNDLQIRHFTTGFKFHQGLNDAEIIRRRIRQLRDLVAQRKACDVAELEKGVCYVKREGGSSSATLQSIGSRSQTSLKRERESEDESTDDDGCCRRKRSHPSR